jgi:hypothetical protein
MRWIVLIVVLLTALVIAGAVLVGESGKETKRPPRVRPAPSQTILLPL